MSGSAWEVRFSNSRQVPYFHNTETRESIWDVPKGMTEEQIRNLPGAQQYLYGGGGEAANRGQGGDEVRASHLLVKHRGSRRPSSWKESNITRSEEEARAILSGYQSEIGQSAAKFAELAQEHSDDSSHSKGGDLGWFRKGQMQKPFEDATLGLRVGEISGIVKTDSGLHLIMRTG